MRSFNAFETSGRQIWLRVDLLDDSRYFADLLEQLETADGFANLPAGTSRNQRANAQELVALGCLVHLWSVAVIFEDDEDLAQHGWSVAAISRSSCWPFNSTQWVEALAAAGYIESLGNDRYKLVAVGETRYPVTLPDEGDC